MTAQVASKTASLAAALLITSGGWFSSAAWAQAQEDGLIGGARFTADVSLGLRYEAEEDDETETRFGNTFTLGVFSITRNQRFAFQVGAFAGWDDLEDSAFDVTNPRIGLDYAIFNRGYELSFDIDYVEAEVGDDDDDDDFDADDLLDDDTGTRETASARVRLITGRDARFGTDTVLGYRQVTYTDVTDPDLVDLIGHDLSTTLRFTLDPRIELRFFFGWEETDEEDAVNTLETVTTAGIAGDFLIDRAWRSSARLSFDWTETEIDDGFGGRITTEAEGYTFSNTVTRDMRNGSLAFAGTRRDDDGLAFSSLVVTRALELPGGAAVSAAGGVVIFDDGEARPLLGLAYDHEILRGRTISFDFTQRPGFNDDDETVIRTVAEARYTHDLTRISRMAVTGDLRRVDVIDGVSDDAVVATLGLSYTHDLTRDWSLTAAASREYSYEDGDRTDRTDVISLNLARSFSWRP